MAHVDHPREGEEPDRLGLPFWQLWSASSLSNLADGLVKIALPLVAVTLTDSPGLVAVAAGLVLATLVGMTQVTDTAISSAEHDSTVDLPGSG
jgi:hypothetical protein